MSIWNTLKDKWQGERGDVIIQYYQFLDENTEESVVEKDIQKWMNMFGKSLEDIQKDWEFVKQLRICEAEASQIEKRIANRVKINEAIEKLSQKSIAFNKDIMGKMQGLRDERDKTLMEIQKVHLANAALNKAENQYPNILQILGIMKPEK